MSEIDDVRAEFAQLWGRLAGFWGIPPATARLYAWLLSSAEGRSADELVDALQMSRGAVSMSMRELVDCGLALQQHEPGSRRLVYRAETDLEKVIRNIVQMRKRREWDPVLQGVREWSARLEKVGSADARVFRERMQSIEELVGLADSMAESFLKGGLVQQLGLKMLVAKARRDASKGRALRATRGKP